jgi:hypothetical protein
MSVEANIIFREKASAIVVPAEAIAGNVVQSVNNGRIERVPVKIGIRGSRNVEVIGDVSRGMAVLSPARPDLADGTRVRPERNKQVPQEPAPDLTPDEPQQSSATLAATPTRAPSPPLAPSSRVGGGDPDAVVISSAISAHIDSVVNDARRNVSKFGAGR